MEEPLLKRQRRDSTPTSNIACCIICSEECLELQKQPNADNWLNFQSIAQEYKAYEGKYRHVFDAVDWEAGPEGHLWHKNCKWKMSNKKSISQAERNFQKNIASTSQSSADPVRDEKPGVCRTRMSTGPLQSSDLCIYCMKGYDPKHPQITLRVIETTDGWNNFKQCVHFMNDVTMKERLEKFIDSTLDPFAEKIRYHDKCNSRNI